MKLINLTGQIFKGWKVLEHTHTGKQSAWLCECTCDTENKTQKVFISSKLRSGILRPCHCDKIVENGCEVCGDTLHNVMYSGMLNQVLCAKHYNQIKTHGSALDNVCRTRHDDNEFIIYDEYAEIVLFNKQHEEVGRAIIDADDLKKCQMYKWRMNNARGEFGFGYAMTYVNGKLLLLHKLITNTTNDVVIDHIDCNKLNCKKDNLRLADKSKNSQNRKPPNNNTSGFTGVYWNKNRSKWYARISADNIHRTIGSVKDLKNAVLMRIEAEIKYFKNFRNPHNQEQYIKRFGFDDDLKQLLKNI